MILTSVKSTKRGRISVFVDDEFLFAVHRDAWYDSKIAVGHPIDEDTLNELLLSSQKLEAKSRALNMLARQSYTASVLKKRLSEKSGMEAAQQAVDRMEELGYINDEDYAYRYAKELFYKRRFAPKRIYQELYLKGIEKEICQNAIEELNYQEELFYNAEAVIEKKFPNITNEKEHRRAVALLERYGYSYDIIKKVLGHFKEDDS